MGYTFRPTSGFDPINAVVGTFGYIYHEGKWLSQYNKAQASVEIGKAEIKPAGDRWIRHKVVSLKGSGSISGYKVTDELLEFVSVVSNSNKPSFRTELIITLDDPEAVGAERVRLMNVMFDKSTFPTGSIRQRFRRNGRSLLRAMSFWTCWKDKEA